MPNKVVPKSMAQDWPQLEAQMAGVGRALP